MTAVRRKGASAPRSARPSGALAQFADAAKQGGKILPAVERYLLAQHIAGTDDLERRQDVVHPSEIAKTNWCPRSTYYRIAWSIEGRTLPETEKFRFQRENIFYEGDRIHDKWQANLHAMGVLWGRWRCMHCDARFWGQSPRSCEKCGSTAVRYAEVPMQSMAHLLAGQSDGEVRTKTEPNRLIEVKSVGDGTVRVESPTLFARYTHKATSEDGSDHKWFDMAGLFRDIKRPFPSHLRQGYIYLFLRRLMTEVHDWPECEYIVYIYEAKSTQAVKEFQVKAADEFIEEELSACLDIVHALEAGRPPACREGRRQDCPECRPYIESEKSSERDPRPSASPGGEPPRSRDGEDRGGSVSRQGAPRSGDAPADRTTRVARRPRGGERRGADEPDGGVHSLGGLLADAARSRRGR